MTDRQSFIKGVLDRVESHVEQWREQDQRRKAETQEARGKLWEEAIERERLLAQVISEEEAGEISSEGAAREQRVAFVLHSEEGARALREFAGKRVRLMSVVPGKGGHGEDGVRGSWLVFEERL